MRKTVCVVIVFALLFTATLFGGDVTGKWKITLELPRGDPVAEVEMTQQGEALTVVTQGRQGQVTAQGTVKGDSIEWTSVRQGRRGEMKLTYKGKIDGDTMKGTVHMGQQSAEWSAERK